MAATRRTGETRTPDQHPLAHQRASPARRQVVGGWSALAVFRNHECLDVFVGQAATLGQLARHALDEIPVLLDQLDGLAAGVQELSFAESQRGYRLAIVGGRD